MNRQITKIKILKDEVYIEFQQNEDVVKISSPDPMSPDFEEALNGLSSYVVDFLLLPEGWEDDMKVSGLSLKYPEEGWIGVVITAQKPIPGVKSPLIINTPFHQFGESDAIYKALMEAVKEANAYLDGKRAQLNLLDAVAA